MRVIMKNRIFSIWIVSLLVIGGFLIFVDVGDNIVRATDVSGPIFDGSGGPWNLSGSPYIIIGNIVVPAGETLTIEPGVDVKFDGYYRIYVEGNISAIGNETDMINITSNSLTPAPKDWDRIQINHSGHAEIAYCNFSYADFAVWLYGGSNNLTNNSFSNNERGMYISGSDGNNIINNTLTNNTLGIHLSQSSMNNLNGNTMINDGILIYGDQLVNWNSHSIDTSNMVNGKPVYYVTNQTGGSAPQNQGQLIFANCSGMLIDGHEITNTTAAIQLGFCSSNNIISNNNVSNSTSGIIIDHSDGNEISDNNAIMNKQGIIIRHSDLNIITDNNCSDSLGPSTYGSGIYLIESIGNTVYNNTCLNNYRAGIELSYNADGNDIIENNCSYNDYGIICFHASDNNWYNNTCNDNTLLGFYLSGDSIDNTIKENFFNSNGEYGILLYEGNTNTISNNEINWNGIQGVNITAGANNNTIIYNDINNNTEYGLYVDSPDNIIHHNNIAYNNGSTGIFDPTKIQAYDNSTNFWNTSDKGNWWADWTTPDSVAPFGIVDIPYVLDGGGQDNFPLVNPVDPTFPIISNMLPVNGSFITVNITTISANYTDPSGINVSSVVLQLNSTDITSSATVNADGISYTPVTPWTDGIFIVELEVMDFNDNLAYETWFFTVDTTPPSITNKLPAYDSVTSDNMTTINASYSDDSGIDLGSVKMLVNGNDETSNATVTPNNITYIPMTPLADGPYIVDIEVTDLAGWNTAQWWPFTVDAIPPVIFNMLPVNGTIFTVNTTTVSANYTDTPGINVNSVILKINGVNVTSSATVTADGISYTPPAGFDDGVQDVYLEVMNILDNPADASWEFTIDTSGPKITNKLPSDGSVTNDDTISVGANFTDISGIDMGSIVLKIDGTDETSNATISADGISYTPLTSWSDGEYTIELWVNDTLSNNATASWTFTVDTIAPEAITDLAANGPTTDSINLTWTAPGDDDDTGTAIEYEVRYSTAGAITGGNWNSATKYSQSWTPQAAGETEM
jgi:parallel beta-helix repeat protein